MLTLYFDKVTKIKKNGTFRCSAPFAKRPYYLEVLHSCVLVDYPGRSCLSLSFEISGDSIISIDEPVLVYSCKNGIHTYLTPCYKFEVTSRILRFCSRDDVQL